MPFNPTDFQKAPWAPGIMTLTDDECLHVITESQKIRESYKPEENYYDPVSDMYVQAEYNKIDWTKGVNGDTFAVLMGYNPEINRLGINEFGIIQDSVEESEEKNEEMPPVDKPEEVEPEEGE